MKFKKFINWFAVVYIERSLYHFHALLNKVGAAQILKKHIQIKK
jgi:hypothetical protein